MINYNLVKNVLLTLLLSMLVSGCATFQYQQQETLSSKESAKIYVVRSPAFWGGPISAPVYVNNIKIGNIGSGGSLSWKVRPGATTIKTTAGVLAMKLNNDLSSSVSFNAKKGKVYYFKVIMPYQVALITPAFEVQSLDEKSGQRLSHQLLL